MLFPEKIANREPRDPTNPKSMTRSDAKYPVSPFKSTGHSFLMLICQSQQSTSFHFIFLARHNPPFSFFFYDKVTSGLIQSSIFAVLMAASPTYAIIVRKFIVAMSKCTNFDGTKVESFVQFCVMWHQLVLLLINALFTVLKRHQRWTSWNPPKSTTYKTKVPQFNGFIVTK